MSQEILIYLMVSSILSLIFSVLALIIGSYAAIVCVGSLKATHTVTYMPIDEEIDKANKAFMENQDLTSNEELWATSDEELAKQDKLYREDLEDIMPEFVPSDKDKKKYSF